MIHSYKKNQREALFIKFILVKNSTCFGQICSPSSGEIYFGKELYMFRTDLQSIIRSLNTIYTVIGICHANYVGCLLARSDSQRN